MPIACSSSLQLPQIRSIPKPCCSSCLASCAHSGLLFASAHTLRAYSSCPAPCADCFPLRAPPHASSSKGPLRPSTLLLRTRQFQELALCCPITCSTFHKVWNLKVRRNPGGPCVNLPTCCSPFYNTPPLNSSRNEELIPSQADHSIVALMVRKSFPGGLDGLLYHFQPLVQIISFYSQLSAHFTLGS